MAEKNWRTVEDGIYITSQTRYLEFKHNAGLALGTRVNLCSLKYPFYKYKNTD